MTSTYSYHWCECTVYLLNHSSKALVLMLIQVWIRTRIQDFDGQTSEILHLTFSSKSNSEFFYPKASMNRMSKLTWETFILQRRTSSASEHEITSIFSVFWVILAILYPDPAEQNQCGWMWIRIHNTVSKGSNGSNGHTNATKWGVWVPECPASVWGTGPGNLSPVRRVPAPQLP
jgi:hypothetical protein